jgi:ribosome biogenesis GTPase / thiamine phosphate phosphatase
VTGDALGPWGLDDGVAGRLEELLQADQRPGRVVAEHKGGMEIVGPEGDVVLGEVSGRLRHEAVDDRDLPAVGDWVAWTPSDEEGRATVHAVAPRHSAFVRRAAGTDPVPQVVAANVDVVLIVTGLDGDLSPRRLERYLVTVVGGGAEPVVVLTKADLAGDTTAAEAAVRAVAPDITTVVVDNLSGAGQDAVRAVLRPGRTVALVGSSGVGKSTLANALLGDERQETSDVRDDGRGRHTTTHRSLFPVPGGALLLDTPGMREIGLWDDRAGLDAAFPEIAHAAAGCRFGDCSHVHEPGCAVIAAVEAGEIAPARLDSYRRLGSEIDQLDDDRERRRRSKRGRRR